ncbi:MAG TPA: serine/threonine-protein kinase [Polyangiaceae bacterium]|nr:serine/threonine-protein kinase [Polyangiaceae bacterium]
MTGMPNLPELTVGPASRRGAVTVLPLFAAAPPRQADYRLGADAIADGALVIRELAQGMDAGQLEALNRDVRRVLLVEGDHLLGINQNRVLTSTALVGGFQRLGLPVSCVERGRSRPHAKPAPLTVTGVPAGLRRIVKRTVTQALLSGRSRAADQDWIWGEIADQQRRLRVRSATAALAHTFAERAGEIGDVAGGLPYAPGAVGLAIGVGAELVSIDLFDAPATCAHYWQRLVQGAALEGLSSGPEGLVGGAEVHALLEQLRGASWTSVAPVGEGEELRAATPAGASASALLFGPGLVHFGAVTGAPRAGAADTDGVLRSGPGRRPAPMRYQLPEALAGRYTIAGRIGVGGAKEVFRATPAGGGPDVAIARVPGVEPEAFEHEVAILRRVESEYVPRIFESLVDEYGDGYLVMERCDGPSLAQIVARGPLSVDEAGPIVLAFARGLRTIHDAAVLHRDVKLENVMLSSTPAGATALKILDFGLSAQATSAATSVGRASLAGTFPYMAREVLTGQGLDARSDVYAFGVCCYRLLVGDFPLPPAEGESDLAYLSRLCAVRAHDLSRLPASLPEAARLALEAMLDARRERRPFMPEVVAAFERSFADAPLAAPAGAPRAAPARRLELARSSRIEAPVATPEHLLVAPCVYAPLVVLEPDPSGRSTEVRAFSADGSPRWSRWVEGRLTAGLRADLDGDGVRELYLAGPGRVAALDATGQVRFSNAIGVSALAPTLVTLPGASPRFAVDGRVIDPRTGLDVGRLPRVFRGDGRGLQHAADPRGLAYNGFASQAFCGANGTAAAIVYHPGDDRFHVAHLEEGRSGRRVQLAVYGPGGPRTHGLSVAECDLGTGDAAEIDRLIARGAPLFGPEHSPLAALDERGQAVVIAPLLGADRALPSCLSAFALPSGREAWRYHLDVARGARALLADVDGDGRVELVVGTGEALAAYDAWTGEPRGTLACDGLPVAFGDPFATGSAHLITASPGGIELWRGPRCQPGAMHWVGPRADLWRTGTLRPNGLPLGPV